MALGNLKLLIALSKLVTSLNNIASLYTNSLVFNLSNPRFIPFNSGIKYLNTS